MRSGVSVCTSETQMPFRRAERDKTLFSIAKPIVFERESQASEDFLSVDEIKAVILEILSSLGFAPRKPHHDSVYTFRRFIKLISGVGLTNLLTGVPVRSRLDSR